MNQELAFKLKAEVTGQQALDRFRKSVDDISGSTGSVAGTLGKLSSVLKGLAFAYVAKQAFDFGAGLIETADEMRAFSEKTGIGVQALASFKVAAEESNLPFDGLQSSLRKFSVNVIEARNGSKELTAAFQNVGVSASELQKLSTEDLIKKLADNFQNLKDGPEKAANAVKLFGKAGADMIPFLNQGSAELERFKGALDDDLANRADAFGDSITRIGASFKNQGFAALSRLLPTLQEVLDAFENSPSQADGFLSTMDILSETIRVLAVTFNYLTDVVIIFFDALYTGVKQVVVAAIDTFKTFAAVVNGAADAAIKFATGDFSGAAAAAKSIGENTGKAFNQGFKNQMDLGAAFSERLQARAKAAVAFDDALSKNSFLLGNGTIEQIREAQKAATAPPKRSTVAGASAETGGLGARGAENDRIKEFIALQNEENKSREQQIADIGKSTIEINRNKEARDFDKQVLKLAKGDLDNLTESQKEQIEVLKEQRLALVDLEYQTKRAFSTGAKEAFRDYVESATDAAKNAKELFSNSFKAMEDALVDFAKTGKFNFASFADSIISDLIRIAVRQAILGPLLQAAGGLFGGAFGGAGGFGAAGGAAGGSVAFAANGGIMTAKGMARLNTYSNGGIANSPQLAVFGEGSRPEAYVPLPDGRRIPVVQQGGGAGGVSVVVNVNMESGAEDSRSNSDTGKQLGQLISAAVKNELINARRPGGLLAG